MQIIRHSYMAQPKKRQWQHSVFARLTLLSLICLLSACSTLPPDVPVCVEINPIEGFCTQTISGKSFTVDDHNKLDGKTWWELKPATLRLPAASWRELKKFIIKNCKQTQTCQNTIATWERTITIIDETLNTKIPGEEYMSLVGLKYGDAGARVEKLQTLLKAHGYTPGIIDGLYGTKTKMALRDFLVAKTGKQPSITVDITAEVEVLLLAVDTGQKQTNIGVGADIIPFAVQLKERMKTKGPYAGGYPRGALVHFTAGAWKTYEAAVGSTKWGIKQGYAFLNIAYDGRLIQAHNVRQWGHHAGESAWRRGISPLVGSVSDDLIGIEMANPGILSKQKDGTFKTYFGAMVEPELVRYVTEKEYGCPTGYYMKYHDNQEKTLTNTVLWLYRNDPTGRFSIDHVLGHHEVAGKLGIGYFRKNDPGGALSMPMDDYRAYLKRLV